MESLRFETTFQLLVPDIEEGITHPIRPAVMRAKLLTWEIVRLSSGALSRRVHQRDHPYP
jgi:hypothetical protein